LDVRFGAARGAVFRRLPDGCADVFSTFTRAELSPWPVSSKCVLRILRSSGKTVLYFAPALGWSAVIHFDSPVQPAPRKMP
jgi:hypothetical protein